MPRVDVAVIGAGLAGLTCAAELAERGASVFLAAKGMATTHWTHGGLDVGVAPDASTPREAARRLAAIAGHPYAALADDLEPAVTGHLERCAAAGLDYAGTLDAPLVPVPTAIGSLRPAAILPLAQAAALEPWGDDGLLLVGFRRYRDFWPAYAARNLEAGEWSGGPRRIAGVEVTLPGLEGLRNLNGQSLARLFDGATWRTAALRAIAAAIPAGTWRIGLPAVLGLLDHAQAHADAERILGARAFEIASLPPSVPGLRLFEALRGTIARAGGRIQIGFDVVSVERDGSRVAAIHTEAASRTLRIAADAFVLATGGIAGTGFRAGHDGTIRERVFGLAVTAPPRERWLAEWPLEPQPLEEAGIRTDANLVPAELENVRVIGTALAGMRYLDQRCGDGVALASAHRAAASLADVARAEVVA